jgi:PAS domain-containing protein
LESLISEVISRVRECEREVQDKYGRWFSLRVRPYLTVENKVDGAVLVLVDIDALKRAELEAKLAHAYAQTVIEDAPPLLILDSQMRVISGNQSLYKHFKASPAQTENILIYELGNGQWRKTSNDTWTTSRFWRVPQARSTGYKRCLDAIPGYTQISAQNLGGDGQNGARPVAHDGRSKHAEPVANQEDSRCITEPVATCQLERVKGIEPSLRREPIWLMIKCLRSAHLRVSSWTTQPQQCTPSWRRLPAAA